ncbi:MAG TPA: EamA family transporter RarD [Anaerolineae bacterium]|nr:EamA family transporter RarD [Anaerolineae bacterium]
MNRGIISAALAYFFWGLFPIYWKLLQHVPAVEILSHRMSWSLIFVLLLLAYQNHWNWVKPTAKQPRVLLTYLLSASLLALNWGLYIWGVNAGFILETSLGYFINPLVSVVLGVFFLGETLRRGQWVAVATATTGVIYLTIQYGQLPWIALTLAFSFGIYGYIRKTAALSSLEGLTLETAWLFLPAVGYLIYLELNGQAAFGHVDTTTTLLLALAGAVTAIPLLLFAQGARLIPLSMIGILQYMAPTIQFLLGVFVYGEKFGPDRLVGFSLVWAALAIYTAEGWQHRQHNKSNKAKPA